MKVILNQWNTLSTIIIRKQDAFVFTRVYMLANNVTYFGRSSLFIAGKAAESTIAPHCPSTDLYRQEIHKYLDQWLEMILQTVLAKISGSNLTNTFLSSSNQWNEI